MNDKPKILVGLAIALVGLTFPLWRPLAAGPSSPPPALELPANHSKCVEDAPYMRARHMDLLNQWRNSVVREGKRTYVSKAFGETFEMSLSKTCMGCHESRRKFCDRCHTYVNLRTALPCWECHTEPKEK